MAQFDVDTSVLRTQGKRFVDIGADFGTASKKLQDTLEGLGSPWEDANWGDIFGPIYEPVRDGIFTSMDSLGKRMQEMGHHLQDMAKNYDASDDSSVHTLGGIQA